MKLACIIRRSPVAVALATFLALGPSPARGATTAVESELVQQGVAAYNDLEYARAIQLFHQALQETLTYQEKRLTYMTLAFSHFALGQSSETIDAFEN